MSNSVNLSLDVTKTGIQNPLIKVRQGDGGFETLHTTVTSNGEPMDLQGWTITFMGTTAGNHKIVDGNVTLIEAPNGIFDYTPSKAWGMDIGEFKIAYFKFVKGDGSASSANLRVNVIEAVDLTQEEAKNYISVVDTTIAEINQHLTDSLANVTKSIADANTNANTVASNVNSLGNRVDDYNNKLAEAKVGGRNLFVGSRNFDGEGWLVSKDDLVQSDFQGLTSVSTSAAWSGAKYSNSVLEKQGKVVSTNTQYVMSAWVNNTGTSAIDVYLFSGNEIDLDGQKVATLPAQSGWIHIASNPFKFTKTTGLSGAIRFEGSDAQGGEFKRAGLKLEIGNMATDWTPAPEDAPNNDEQLVHKTGTETIAGDKTFTGSVKFSGNVGLDTYVKKTNALPAEARDFNYLATHMKTYQGFWYNGDANIANAPASDWSWTVIEVVAGNSETTGLIRTSRFGYNQNVTYLATVVGGKINPWKLIADDASVVHNTGNETIAGDKTFTGTVSAAQKVYTRTIGSITDLLINYTRVGNVVTGRYAVVGAGTFTLTNNDGYKSPSSYPVNVISYNANAWFTIDNKFTSDKASTGNFVFITNDPLPAN